MYRESQGEEDPFTPGIDIRHWGKKKKKKSFEDNDVKHLGQKRQMV